MTNRFTTRHRLTGKLAAQLRKFLNEAFDSSDGLRNFVRDKFGKDTYNAINWNQANMYACADLISHCQSRQKVGQLVELLKEVIPDVVELDTLIAYMVDAGYLNDSTKPVAASTNPNNRDWMSEYSYDRIDLSGLDRAKLIQHLTGCFTTTAEVERFIGDNFQNELGKTMLQCINRNETVATVIERIVSELARIHWFNCFVMAVQAAHQDKLELGFSAVVIGMAYRPAPPPVPVAKPVQPPPPAAKPVKKPAPVVVAETKPSPKAFRVVRAKGKLTPALQRELVALMLHAFQKDSLGQLVHYNLNVHLDHIVASGPLGTMCENLVRWCEEQEDKTVPLLNAILTERPHRTDVKPLLEKLAAAGVIEIE